MGNPVSESLGVNIYVKQLFTNSHPAYAQRPTGSDAILENVSFIKISSDGDLRQNAPGDVDYLRRDDGHPTVGGICLIQPRGAERFLSGCVSITFSPPPAPRSPHVHPAKP